MSLFDVFLIIILSFVIGINIYLKVNNIGNTRILQGLSSIYILFIFTQIIFNVAPLLSIRVGTIFFIVISSFLFLVMIIKK